MNACPHRVDRPWGPAHSPPTALTPGQGWHPVKDLVVCCVHHKLCSRRACRNAAHWLTRGSPAKRLIFLIPEACRRCDSFAESLRVAGKVRGVVATRGRCRNTYGPAWRSAAFMEPPCRKGVATQTRYEQSHACVQRACARRARRRAWRWARQWAPRRRARCRRSAWRRLARCCTTCWWSRAPGGFSAAT